MKSIDLQRRAMARGLALGLSGLMGAVARSNPADASWSTLDFAGRSIRIVVPYPAGGTLDMVARTLAYKLGHAWNATVIVDNRPGASGLIGTDSVVKSVPDGLTLLLTVTALIQTPSLMVKMPYDPLKDLTPVNLVARIPTVLVIRSDMPVNSLPELVALTKANPGKYSLGNYGNGTTSHIQATLLNEQARLGLPHIPYRGVSLLVNDLLAGQVTAGFTDTVTVAQHVAAGRLRILAVTGANRSPRFPDVPTVSSFGFKNFDAYGWVGLFAPAKVPEPVIAKISREVARSLAEPDFIQKLDAAAMLPARDSREEFSQLLRTDTAMWASVIKASNIKMD